MRAKRLVIVLVVLALVGVSAATLFLAVPIHDALECRRAEQREARIKECIGRSFVKVHYHLRKSQRPRPPGDADVTHFDFGDSEVARYVLNKTTRDEVGVLVGPEGRIFVAESYLWPETIERITVEGLDGAVVEATVDRVLCTTKGQMLRIRGDMPTGWAPLEFVAAPEALTRDTELYTVSFSLSEYGARDEEDAKGDWSIGGLYPHFNRGNETDVPDYFTVSHGRGVTVISNEAAEPVALAVYNLVEMRPDAPAWRAADVLADPGFRPVEGQEEIERKISPYLYQIRVTFRPPPKEEDEDSGEYFPFVRSWTSGEQTRQDYYVYALAVAPDRLLVPRAVPQELVAGIDTLSVRVGDEDRRASFGGALRECGLSVVTLDEGTLPEVASVDPAVQLPRTEPFWTVYARELAGKDLVISYARWIRKAQGFEDKWYRQVDGRVQPGAWLVDRQGRVAGVYTPPRRNWDRLLPYLESGGSGRHYYGPSFSSYVSYGWSDSSGWYGPRGEADMCLFDAAQVAAMLESLPDGYDPHIRRLTREEQKQRVWLGVESTDVSFEMAKQLGLRTHTQDGRIGLIVNRVYPGSPAARLGLVEGDVLLKAETAETPWPIELAGDNQDRYSSPEWDFGDVPEEFERMGYRVPRKRPWPSRGNWFTQMLRVVGDGQNVRLTFVHGGQETTKEFTIERSPPDSLSAAKYKDKKLGLTVRELTYEVRAALKLSAEDKAVVISKVDPGTPAALARINSFELIRAVDGNEIASADQFETAVQKAKADGKPSVRLTVEWMGRTRLADLRFEAKAEGMPEMFRRMIPGLQDAPTEEDQP